jgi:predicted nucleic acid-binding protein
MLADTSFLIDLMQDDEPARTKAEKLVSDSVPLMVGTPTIFELYVGVGLSLKSGEEREKVLEVLRALTQLPLDSQSAIRAGIVYAQQAKDGVAIDAEDAMIAGIALENQQTLLTRNTKHFAGIPGLKVEDY